MTRGVYGEDGPDFPGQWVLSQANMARQLTGKKGRALLLELRAALEAMPRHRLIEHRLADGDGDVCTVGALIVARGADPVDLAAKAERASECANCLDGYGDHNRADGSCSVCFDRAKRSQEYWDAKGTPADKRWPTPACQAFEAPDPTEFEEDSAGAFLTVDTAVDAGVPRRLAWRLMDLNDQDMSGLTPEERWQRVVNWIDDTLWRPPSEVVAREIADVVANEADWRDA